MKLGGKFHLKLNMGSKPIANKYHEGKMKRNLKRELKVRKNGGVGVSLLGKRIIEGENPVCHLQSFVHGIRSKSHVPRDWSANWVVNFISS